MSLADIFERVAWYWTFSPSLTLVGAIKDSDGATSLSIIDTRALASAMDALVAFDRATINVSSNSSSVSANTAIEIDFEVSPGLNTRVAEYDE